MRWANDAKDAAEAVWWIDRHPGLVVGAIGLAALVLLAPERAWRFVLRKQPSKEKDKPDPKALHEIARQMRTLSSERNIDAVWPLHDTTSIAGRLLLEAIDSGAFSGTEYFSFRHVAEMSFKGEYAYQRREEYARHGQTPQWNVFVNCLRWLWRRDGTGHVEYSNVYIKEGCPYVARLIEDEAKRIERSGD